MPKPKTPHPAVAFDDEGNPLPMPSAEVEVEIRKLLRDPETRPILMIVEMGDSRAVLAPGLSPETTIELLDEALKGLRGLVAPPGKAN